MQYKCEVCHDSGSKNQTGDYLDCPTCDMPHTRKALNDFVKSLGPTHPEDVALAIHQRALAMAPKQEALADERVAFIAEYQLNGTMLISDDAGGFSNPWVNAHWDGWQRRARFAAPAAANGALTDKQIDTIWDSLPGLKIVAGRPIDHWNYLLRHEFARQVLAAAGPDAALVKALENLVALYDTDEGCRSTPEYIAAHIALSGAKGN